MKSLINYINEQKADTKWVAIEITTENNSDNKTQYNKQESY